MPGPETNTLYYGDCLDWMQDWPDECVDLIYLDPPFNSNADYNILFGTENGTPAQVRGFQDTWKWDDVAGRRSDRLERAVGHSAHTAAVALKTLIGPSGMLAYLTYMAERLAAMRRLLKPSGGVILHCDDTAAHYLKIVMDAIFGSQQFRNDIIWRRATAHNDATRFGRIADHLLYYGKSERPYWNADAYLNGKTEAELRRAYPSTDERGRYRSDNLTGPLHNAPKRAPSTLPWRNYDVHELGRCWSVPKTGAYAEYIEREFIPGYRDIEGIHDRLDALDEHGLIHHPKAGKWPGLKRYADADRGRRPQSIILEPTGYTNYSTKQAEYLGYPTQKRPELLEMLLKATCPTGGVVLDPFCGCGTSIVAAHNLGMRWIGIDISSFAIDLVQERRLAPLGIQAGIRGIPFDLTSARKLAQDSPFDFEVWALQRITGLIPNERQVGDSGVDGRGMLLNRPVDFDSNSVIAQVKGGKRFDLSAFRDFLHVVEREQAACGIFITVEPVSSPRARAEAAAAGTIRIGGDEYPRVQLWTIHDYFEGRTPKLPMLADPYTGEAAQPTLFAQQHRLGI